MKTPKLSANDIKQFENEFLGLIAGFEDKTGFSPRLFVESKDDSGHIIGMALNFALLGEKDYL